MVDKRIPFQPTKTPPKEKIDDLKTQLTSKSTSLEWANFLIKKFCEETVKIFKNYRTQSIY
jgi:archaellum component FlaD/FlaE